MIKYIILFPLIVYCGKIDDVFLRYVAEFEKYSKVSDKVSMEIILKFTKSKTAKGKCNTRSKRIQINFQYFKKLTYNERLWLVFHELGHCSLGRHHNNAVLKDKCPASIMNHRGVHEKCFLKHKKYYLRELFN